MCYQRIIEFNDVDPSWTTSYLPSLSHRGSQAIFGQASFPTIAFGPRSLADLLPLEKGKRDQLDSEDVAYFKRVRLLSTIRRVRQSEGTFRPFIGLAQKGSVFLKLRPNSTKANHVSRQSPPVLDQTPNRCSLDAVSEGGVPSPIDLGLLACALIPRTVHTPTGEDSDSNPNFDWDSFYEWPSPDSVPTQMRSPINSNPLSDDEHCLQDERPSNKRSSR